MIPNPSLLLASALGVTVLVSYLTRREPVACRDGADARPARRPDTTPASRSEEDSPPESEGRPDA